MLAADCPSNICAEVGCLSCILCEKSNGVPLSRVNVTLLLGKKWLPWRVSAPPGETVEPPLRLRLGVQTVRPSPITLARIMTMVATIIMLAVRQPERPPVDPVDPPAGWPGFGG